jgi:hypothetical protein
MATTESRSSPRRPVSALRQAVTAPVRAQTYKNILYLALAFPLGLLYFVGLITGASLGIGLLITWVGLPILGVTLAGVVLGAGLEARLATNLVGIDASLPTFLQEFEVRDGIAAPGDGFLGAVKRLATAPTTWTSVILVLPKFVFGLVSFVALVLTGTISAVLLAAPLIYQNPSQTLGFAEGITVGQFTVGPWVVDTLPEAFAVTAGGIVFLVVALNLLNVLARLQATYTAVLLRIGENSA